MEKIRNESPIIIVGTGLSAARAIIHAAEMMKNDIVIVGDIGKSALSEIKQQQASYVFEAPKNFEIHTPFVHERKRKSKKQNNRKIKKRKKAKNGR